jgi:hypothetical protein
MGSKTHNSEGPTVSQWRDHQLFVTETLTDLKDDFKSLRQEFREDIAEVKQLLHAQDKEIERLKLKSGIYGLMGGVVTGISVKLVEMLHL